MKKMIPMLVKFRKTYEWLNENFFSISMRAARKREEKSFYFIYTSKLLNALTIAGGSKDG